MCNQIEILMNSHKRKEIDRIRRLIRARNDLQAGHKVPAKTLEINDIATHMDHADPHFFTETDIHRLLTTAVKNLEDTDTYRHERFREYEMRKAIKRENFLSHLTPAERENANRNEKVKHRNWRKANPMAHPGSARHFMNVWRNYDGMTDDFNKGF